MKVYMYQSSLYCEECGKEIVDDLGAPPHDWPWDSGDYPVGPEEAGEADSPQHCESCHVFLENPLTNDGDDYVIEQFTTKTEVTDVMREWAEHYDYLGLRDIEEVREQLRAMKKFMGETPNYGKIYWDETWWTGKTPAHPEFYVPQDWQDTNRPVAMLWNDYLGELAQLDKDRLAEADAFEVEIIDLLIASESEMVRRDKS